ncbi:hypothetical protein ABZP36_001983 [Zizania latifolia]
MEVSEGTVTAGRGDGGVLLVQSLTAESSSQPSGCTNGNGAAAGGYCHPPAIAGRAQAMIPSYVSTYGLVEQISEL